MTVKALIAGREPTPTIRPDASVNELIRHLRRHDVGAVVVSRDGAAIDGVVSERDIVHALADAGPDVLQRPVDDVMTSSVATVGCDGLNVSVMNLMLDRYVRHAPVVEKGRYVGMVSIGDIVRRRMEEVTGQRSPVCRFMDAETD